MGREIRMVPPNWEHPKKSVLHSGLGYVEERQPMHDSDYASACEEWKVEFLKWEAGEKFENLNDDGSAIEYWDWNGMPPNKEFYRPWKDEEATWFQVWETVTEGTPVTPPFATQEELIEYLVENGDFWDQSRGGGPWSRKSATAFVMSGWAPSFAVVNGSVIESKDCAAELGEDAKA